MLIETGSPFSIITKELAEILGVEVQETQVDLSSPDGGEIIVYGNADVDLDKLGQKIGQEFLIGNLDKVNLLGIEVLRGPPKSEYIFQTWVDKPFQGVGLFELTKHVSSKGLHLTRSLCDPIQGVVTVSVLNIREKPVILESEAVVGTIESVNGNLTDKVLTTNSNTQLNNVLPTHLQPMLDENNPILKDVKRFLEVATCSYHCCFTQNCFEIASQLTQLTRKSVRFKLDKKF